jgi:ribosomal protein L11 methyltransferase
VSDGAFGWQLVVDCRALSVDERELVAADLWCHPITGIEERGDELVVGFVSESDARAAARDIDVPSAIVEVVDDGYLDEWRQFARAWTVGRLFVRPSWIIADAPAGAIEIVLDPQRAFGSGGHPSTRLALELLQKHDVRGRVVLDVGCGSGVLAIAACALGARQAIAIDIDPDAVATTIANARRNGVGERVDARVATASDIETSVDLALINVLPSVHRTVARSITGLTPIVIAAGLLEAQIDEVVTAYRGRLDASIVDEGWAGLDLRVDRD